MDVLQILGRILYRSFVVAMLCLIYSPTAYYGLPLGILLGIFSESKNITKL